MARLVSLLSRHPARGRLGVESGKRRNLASDAWQRMDLRTVKTGQQMTL